MRRVPVVVAACIAVALVVTQTACSHSQGPSPSPPPYDPPTEVTTPAVVPTFETLWTDETYCPETHPVPMGMVPESSDEEDVLRYLAVCTTEPTTGFPDGKGFYIKNYDKAAVWILDAPTLHWTNPDLQPLDLQVYRENMADLGMAGLTVEPGQSLRNTDSDPMRLHMRLDGAAQFAWQLLALGIETVEAKGVNGMPRVLRSGVAAGTRTPTAAHGPADLLLGPSSPTRPAMFTCIREAYQFGSSIEKERSNSDSNFMSRLGLYLDLTGNVTACGKAWSNARTAPGGAITAQEMLNRQRTSVGWSRGDTVVRAANRGFTWVLKACSFVSRC